jgi:hypothetical protein
MMLPLIYKHFCGALLCTLLFMLFILNYLVTEDECLHLDPPSITGRCIIYFSVCNCVPQPGCSDRVSGVLRILIRNCIFAITVRKKMQYLIFLN